MLRILFLCTGNSARSILAEAIASRRHGERIDATSAGSRPKGAPHPLALDTLRRHGIDAAGLRSKSWDEVTGEPFDLVITLCGSARDETCPAFPGDPDRVHWPLPDPPAADDPSARFEAVFEALDGAIDAIAHAAPGDPLRAAAMEAGVSIGARFAGE